MKAFTDTLTLKQTMQQVQSSMSRSRASLRAR
jgi:hypothetical protein